jgi:ribosomal protein S18 acetylase RimI-like enzyme
MSELVSGVIEIRAADGPEDLAQVMRLFKAYAASLSVDLCFQNFAEELAGLPGLYVPPRGRLFLARRAGTVVGCVGMKPLSAEAAEMKRLYVEPAARGLAVGRQLVNAVIAAARDEGYRALYLDTLPEMVRAQALYRALGFVETGPYVANPVEGAKFMRLTLA